MTVYDEVGVEVEFAPDRCASMIREIMVRGPRQLNVLFGDWPEPAGRQTASIPRASASCPPSTKITWPVT